MAGGLPGDGSGAGRPRQVARERDPHGPPAPAQLPCALRRPGGRAGRAGSGASTPDHPGGALPPWLPGAALRAQGGALRLQPMPCDQAPHDPRPGAPRPRRRVPQRGRRCLLGAPRSRRYQRPHGLPHVLRPGPRHYPGQDRRRRGEQAAPRQQQAPRPLPGLRGLPPRLDHRRPCLALPPGEAASLLLRRAGRRRRVWPPGRLPGLPERHPPGGRLPGPALPDPGTVGRAGRRHHRDRHHRPRPRQPVLRAPRACVPRVSPRMDRRRRRRYPAPWSGQGHHRASARRRRPHHPGADGPQGGPPPRRRCSPPRAAPLTPSSGWRRAGRRRPAWRRAAPGA